MTSCNTQESQSCTSFDPAEEITVSQLEIMSMGELIPLFICHMVACPPTPDCQHLRQMRELTLR